MHPDFDPFKTDARPPVKTNHIETIRVIRKDSVEHVEVFIEIDVTEIARILGSKAATSKRNKAQALYGAIVARVER